MDLRRCRNGYFTFNKNAECLISQRTIADCSVQTTLQCAKENTVQCARGPTWAHIRRARRDTYSIHLIALAHRVLLYLKKKKKTQTNERSAIVCALHKYWSHFDLFRITTTITNGFVHQYATESLYVFSHCALLFIERIDLHAAMETHCKISSDWRWH